jgi:exodeoxyribonuclease-1
MRIVQACSLFAPDSLIFPTGSDGEKIFKLDHVAPANGFKHDNAHDAMGDVEATIFICRLLIEKAPEVWSAFMRFSKKAAVVDYIQADPVFCLSDFYYGKPFSWIVTAIGQNEQNQPEWYVYNLEVEPESLMPFSEKDLAMRMGELPKPVRRLKSNAVPMLFPADDAPTICKGRNCGFDELQRRADVVQADAAFKARLISAFESKNEPYPASPYVEQQIYNGFIQKEDERLMNDFHEAEWHNRPAIVEKFKDPRLKEIGRKLIHIERPDLLDEGTRRELDLMLFRRIMGVGEKVPWLTLPQALQDFGAVKANADPALLQRLLEHEQYLRQRHEQARAHLGDQRRATA